MKFRNLFFVFVGLIPALAATQSEAIVCPFLPEHAVLCLRKEISADKEFITFSWGSSQESYRHCTKFIAGPQKGSHEKGKLFTSYPCTQEEFDIVEQIFNKQQKLAAQLEELYRQLPV